MRAKQVRASLAAAAAILAIPLSQFTTITAVKAASNHATLNCALSARFCTEVADSEAVFGEGHYVGHDEPSTLFYSNKPGAGNSMTYQLTLPRDPNHKPLDVNGNQRTYNFMLHPAFWFVMAMCDTMSYPEFQNTSCTPDSDTNITSLKKHAGTAFMEMQFYPPGWQLWPAGNSCDKSKWCAALNIDSLSINPSTGQQINSTCLNQLGGNPEYVNFAFITLDGNPTGPPNPINSTNAGTFTPDKKKDLFMSSGDVLKVDLHDTTDGLKITIDDKTSGQSGFMVTSAANHFGQVQWDPTGTSCNNIDYNFHPMYSTSSEKTRVPWAAHSYNIAFADETGHFDYCSGGTAPSFGGTCPSNNTEGVKGDTEPTDGDNFGCFPAPSASGFVQVAGCLGGNSNFDGPEYKAVWPDGNPNHPEPIRFTSPTTPATSVGTGVDYERVAFEADLPRIERNSDSAPNSCDKNTGANCTLIPKTDENVPADFYPFFSSHNPANAPCEWLLGNDVPGLTTVDYGQNSQYGTLLQLTYESLHGATITRYNDFRQVLNGNPCPATLH